MVIFEYIYLFLTDMVKLHNKEKDLMTLHFP